MTIRAATPDDLDLLTDALGADHHAFFRDHYRSQRSGSGEILLAFRDGRPVGGVFLSWGPATEPEVRRHLPGVPVIFHLHVAPASRRRGVGRALLRRAEANLRARGHDRVLLGVDRSNTIARDLYLRLGYVQPAEPELRDLGAAAEPYDILVADLDRPG